MMEKMQRTSMFLRVLALVMAVGLLFGAIPAAALDTDVPGEPESVTSEADVPSEEPSITDETADPAAPEADAEEATEAELEQKGDADLAPVENEGVNIDPKDVTITTKLTDGDRYSYRNVGDYYTGIGEINITFPKAEGLETGSVVAAFSRDFSDDTEDSNIPWWEPVMVSGRKVSHVNVTTDGENIKINMKVKNFVSYAYGSNFADGKADGLYTLAFVFDTDGENPIIYREKFVIRNAAPTLSVADNASSAEWQSQKVRVAYVADSPVGIDSVTLYDSSYNRYSSCVKSEDYMDIGTTGTYYIRAVDKLGLATEYEYVGSYKIDLSKVTFGQEIKYEKAAPGSDEWAKDEAVKVTFKVNTPDSGVAKVVVKGTDTEATSEGDGKYSITFTENKNQTVEAVSNVGRKGTLEIAAPQIDNDPPSKDSIDYVSIRSDEKSKLLNFLSFGLYENKKLILTVYTTGKGAPITAIDVDNDQVKKSGSLNYDEATHVASQSFEIPVGETAEDSDYTNLSFTLTNKVDSKSEPIALKKIARITLDAEDTLELTGEALDELIDTKIAPSIDPIAITSDQSDGSVYHNDVKTGKIEIKEPLTGLKSVKAYFGKADQFDADKDYQPKEGATDISDSVSKIDDKSKTTSATFSYEVKDDVESGDYIIYIEATNNSGNTMISHQLFTVDKSAPVITVDELSDKWISDSDMTVTFTVTDEPEGTNSGVKTVTVNDEVLSADEDGVYSFTPKASENYTINAVDAFGNSTADTDKEIKLAYDQIHLDDQAPVIGDFTYNGKDASEWSDKVTLSFKVDDIYNGKTLSGVDEKSVTLTKSSDGSVIEASALTVKDGVFTYEVEDNYIAYTVNIKDKVGNAAVSKTTEVIKRDDTAPEIVKIVFSEIENAKKFGVYGKDAVQATVYTKTGHAAPVSTIEMSYGDEKFTSDGEVTEVTEDDTTYYTRTFAVPASADGNTYSKLSVYAVSAAGVDVTKGIKDINVYAGDAEIKDHTELFEAVAKTSGPAVKIEYSYSKPSTKDVQGYPHNEDGTVSSEQFGSYSFEIVDTIAGVDDDTIVTYFDTVDNFTLDENGEYVPKEDTAKLDGVKWTPTENNEDKKNTETTGAFTESAANESGRYILCVKVKNLSGAEKIAWEEIDIDNSAPVIAEASLTYEKNASQQWVRDDEDGITVSFTVTDEPEGYAIGVKEVKVVGDEDGKDYTVTHNGGNNYSFQAEVSQTYTITATDAFGIKADAVKTARVLVDNDAPDITIEASDLKSYTNDWSKDTKKITFSVSDIWAEAEFENEKAKELSGISSITVTGSKHGSNGSVEDKTYEVTPAVVKGTMTATYSFTANDYQDYLITVKDVAGNTATYDALKNVKVDTIAPEITKVSFKLSEPTKASKMLNFLTFGIFGGASVDMTVEGIDAYPSSSIKNVSITAKNENGDDVAQTKTSDIKKADPDNNTEASTVTSVFRLDPELFSSSTAITINITDVSGQSTGNVLLSNLLSENKVTIPSGFKINNQDFEVVVSGKGPEIKNVKYTGAGASDEAFSVGDTYWFKEDMTLDFTVYDDISKIHSIKAALNGSVSASGKDENLISEYCFEEDGETNIVDPYTDFTPSDDLSLRNDQKVVQKNITFNTASLPAESSLRKLSETTDSNTFAIGAQGNNGEFTNTTTYEFYIDDVTPDITNFSFSGQVDELTGDKATESEKQEIADKLSSTGYTTMTEDNYLYFFENETQVTVSATDGNKGSGVREIHFYAVGKASPNASVEVLVTDQYTKANNNGDLSATFTVPAGFKGSVFAYAVDQVSNTGAEYSPNNLVVENKSIHDSSSSTAISIDTAKTGTDNNGHDLYNSDVTFTLTVEDLYSGIKSIHYSAIGLEDSAKLTKDVTVDLDGKNNDNWTVLESEKNLVYRMSKTITLDGFNAFNSNDIEISVSAVDRSGYVIQESKKVISIDTTAPVIEVTYDPAAGSGNTYGTDEYEYFKVSRTMSVVVYERNFDPADFDYSGILNNYVSGDVPALVAGENWNTTYTDYKGASAHYASFTFANDGDYEIKLNCTDEATNKADEYTGEKFTIDTIDPTVEVSLSGTVKNGKYYNETVTATITVHEHNFAEGDTYVTFSPKTDFDTSYDTASVTPSISGWSGSGDTHTTTVEFSSDGTYSFTFDYKDKALRDAQQFSQTEFVIDKNIDKLIKFIDVTDKTAYDDDIAPKVSFNDTNLDTANTTLERISIDTDKFAAAGNLSHSMNPATGSSRTDSYSNFPDEVDNDGIYKLTATGADLAGNTKTESIIFSVNRFGSTFMLSDSSREWVEAGYVNEARDLDVIEINVNEVTDQKVTVTHNSQTETLQASQYKLTSSGAEEKWYRYNYSIEKANFANEGGYTVTVSSVDTFKHAVDNRTAYHDDETGVAKDCPVSFVVDATDPVVKIDGIESGEPYGDPERTVQIICSDTNIDPESLVIMDEDETVLVKDADYTVEEVPGELDIELIVDRAGKHSLSVSVNDYAMNEGENAVIDYELNASVFTLFFHNTVAVVCTAIALAAIIAFAIFMILMKRKKQEQAQQ